MICKKTNGSGFRGLAQYLLRGGRGHIVAGSMAGRTARELAHEFGQLRRLNPKLRKAVMHFSISPAPGDPALSEAQWQTISQRFIQALGYADAPWVAVVHRDTEHIHMHLMTSRIDLHGRTVSNFNDYRKAEQVMRELEAELGLQAVPGLHASAPTDGPSLAGPAKRRKSKPRGYAPPDTNSQGDKNMKSDTAPNNPFQPGDAQFATWPLPFEPGRDCAVQAFVAAHPEVVQNGASSQLAIPEKEGRAMRRRIVDRDYEERMRLLLGDALTKVYKHPQGATLYFRQKGEIQDMGSKVIATGGMDDKLAAQRLVALGRERGWETITFTGTASFLEHAMRAALAEHLVVSPQGEEQAAILAKVIAERQGEVGSNAVLVAAPTPLLDPVLSVLSELDDIPTQTYPRPAPNPKPVPSPAPPTPAFPATPPQPAQPVVGVLPGFLNLRERLKDRRQSRAPVAPAPNHPTAPKKPGAP